MVCLEITDRESYAKYRAAIQPILQRFGGGFIADIEGEARVNPTSFEFTRMFLLGFPDAATAADFFSDGEYKAARATWFEPAVRNSHVTILAPAG
jgi:uncharacterized protein (DUF1330 family)